MLNVRLYEDFKSMMENEGRNEEVLERFFNTMIEEQNFDLSFYQWCRTNLFYKTIGDFYICTDKNLREQKEKLEELIDGLTDEEIEEVLEIKNYLHKL